MAGAAGGSSDENLEIVFWWLGDDPQASIEDDLEQHLHEPAPRSRRWRHRERRVRRPAL
jgi:hypothetical protein